MRRESRLWILTCLVIWVIATVSFSIFTFVDLDHDLIRLVKVVFMGFGLTCFLIAVMGITGLHFMCKLKEANLTGWKLFIGFYILFSALVYQE